MSNISSIPLGYIQYDTDAEMKSTNMPLLEILKREKLSLNNINNMFVTFLCKNAMLVDVCSFEKNLPFANSFLSI